MNVVFFSLSRLHQGSMVMNYEHEIEQAYRDYQLGKMGRPWSEDLSDEEWTRHVQKYPNRYGGRANNAGRARASMSFLTTRNNPKETVDYTYLDDN
jgi:hypothetical protein